MTKQKARGAEMPAPGEGRPLGGQLDGLDVLFDFQPTFDEAMNKVTSPDSEWAVRHALHEPVCVLATRLDIGRKVLLPLLLDRPDAVDYQQQAIPAHKRIEHVGADR